MTATVVAERPTPGSPRPYHFPPFQRDRLANGLQVITVDLPGREEIFVNRPKTETAGFPLRVGQTVPVGLVRFRIIADKKPD